MYTEPIMAGIVLYNPEIELLKKNVDSIKNQVDCIFLYDNASKNHNEIKKFLESYHNLIYLRSESNGGISKGLNEILRYADENGYKWYLTLDQDSVCAPNLIEEYRKYCADEKLGLVCPVIMNNGKLTFEQYKVLYVDEYDYVSKPIDCITSACLHKTEVVKQVGGYTEDFFNDCVDTDLNCRVLLAGYKILRANKVYLVQQMGVGRNIRFLSKLYKITKLNFIRRIQTVTVYPDYRLYYTMRNCTIIHGKYQNAGFRTSPLFIFVYYFYFTLTYPKERSRIKMWKSIIKGFSDGRKYINDIGGTCNV